MTPASQSIDSAAPGAGRRISFAAIGLIATIYVHFLIFAQFGFLQGIHAAGLTVTTVHRVLGLMALAGIAASVATAWAAGRREPRWCAAAGFALATAASVLAGVALARSTPPPAVLALISVLTGAGLGAATVATAILLRRFTGGAAVGLHVGIGTGLAYVVCNVPLIFTASPSVKAWVSAAGAALGLVCAMVGRTHTAGPPGEGATRYAGLVSRSVVTLATVAFLALVWFDSAAFAAVQNSPAARALFWSGPSTLWTIGACHALAAVVAGALLDRGHLRSVLTAAMVLLVLGHVSFGLASAPWAAPVYVAGVSLYSTALAAFAALGPADAGMPPASRAAWIYSLAGWVGSGAGVGLAEQFGRVPAWAAPAAAVVLLGALTQLRASR